ncbi:MAG: hypothetical protein E7241_07570 [Lachnospiraceae bacterium]|nr:hypothetical protein [Lachnospiraceae bacterium]
MKKHIIKKTAVATLLTLSLAGAMLSGCGQTQNSSSTSASSSHSGAPGKPGGGNSSANITYTGATTFSSDTTESGKTYESSTANEQALLASGGTSTITGSTINKTGDADGDEADFYGTNAAVLAYNGATLNIEKATVTTNGKHANAVFAYGNGIINISDSTINTSSDCSGGIMVTGGGTLTANNCTVTTQGRSSAAIRSDRGGGTLTVNGGTYTSNGVGSPAVYSTADITVNDATLTSTTSEGLIVEGKNSITINNCTVEDTNTKLNSNSGTYKNIFLYQSMSGDADEGTATFTAKNSKFITNNGDTIYVTNTTASVYLENNTITNTSGDFLRIEAGKWGNEGSNGGNVTLQMVNQSVAGSIIVDSISTLDLSLKSGSVLTGAINTANQAKSIKLSLSKDSVLNLTGDTYVTSLENELSDNSNIKSNGYKLYVNGTAVDIG